MLDRANVFCMVSRLPAGRVAGEGFGIVYLEASVHGLPVVAGARRRRDRRGRRRRDRAARRSRGSRRSCRCARRGCSAIAILSDRMGQRTDAERAGRLAGTRPPAASKRSCFGWSREGPMREPHRGGERRRSDRCSTCMTWPPDRLDVRARLPDHWAAERRRRGAWSPRAIGSRDRGSLKLHPRADAASRMDGSRPRGAPRRTRVACAPDVIHANSIRAGLPPSRPRECHRRTGRRPRARPAPTLARRGRRLRLHRRSRHRRCRELTYTGDGRRGTYARGAVEVIYNPVDLSRFDRARSTATRRGRAWACPQGARRSPSSVRSRRGRVNWRRFARWPACARAGATCIW